MHHLGRAILDAPIGSDHSPAEIRKLRPAAMRSARCRGQDRPLEQATEFVHQQPCAPIGHAKLTRRRRNRPRARDGLEQIDLTRPDLPLRWKDDPQPQRRTRKRPPVGNELAPGRLDPRFLLICHGATHPFPGTRRRRKLYRAGDTEARGNTRRRATAILRDRQFGAPDWRRPASDVRRP